MSLKLVGPFKQLLPFSKLSLKGSLHDDQLQIIDHAGILIENEYIKQVGSFETLYKTYKSQSLTIEKLDKDYVTLPGLIDAHTHMCFAGSRHNDYAMRVSGKSYLEIAKSGGGIWDSVIKTRAASDQELKKNLLDRCDRHIREGVTTAEVKSGYGLTIKDELRMLEVIRDIDIQHPIDLVATCLAAHICPKEFTIKKDYLEHIVVDLFPVLKKEGLTQRIDIFVEDSAFSMEDSIWYIEQAQKNNFFITIHADQFSTGGSELACTYHALSADHLEASTENEIKRLAHSDVVATVLPGASLGLGMPFAPTRKLLNAGCCLAVASDWNPGSAPMGDLLMEAAVIGAAEKMTIAETLAAITYRAAYALRLTDRGILDSGKLADWICFPCTDYREILYHQGKMKPEQVYKKGIKF